MNEIDANQLLLQMKIIAAKARNTEMSAGANPVGQSEFGQLLKNAINDANQMQNNASDLAKRFEEGDKNIHLTDVMIATQKAHLSLQAVSQVRNHVVSAYQDIMNMPI
ncbi:flagellar hook-basal body complex protein FliE [Candidatus Berkiella aquae]|uniref:Flagellar hook-basal body complex protein FliE n=1 Tax=Candidatus Berkiella aquae TaxID=295108 RepID=A0A0Q9YZ55_9GAMM|nr:flagellar hook-basal body complex protein FliE [Candidatus Berkiella aquae]MCS5711427.1 flagellar hook-basal body complex protein FliE [Candidatus Berkiella aquae]